MIARRTSPADQRSAVPGVYEAELDQPIEERRLDARARGSIGALVRVHGRQPYRGPPARIASRSGSATVAVTS